MESTFKIEEYKPKRELVLKSTQNIQSWIVGGVLGITVVAISLIIILQSWFPLFIFIFLLIGIQTFKFSFINKIIFDADKISLEYNIGFVNWKTVQVLDSGIDWFVNLSKNPAVIKLGYEDKIILQFSLESLEELPILTENITALTDLKVATNHTLGQWEALRFRNSRHTQNDDFIYLDVFQDAELIQVKLSPGHSFKIDLKTNQLIFTEWFVSKTVDLQNIESIFYEIETGTMLRQPHKALWYYKDKQSQEERHFFSFKRTSEEYQDIQYYQLKFKEESEKLAKILKSTAALNGIEVSKIN